MEKWLQNLQWLGHASFLVRASGKTIYLDPWRLKEAAEPADLILITHNHYDHCSAEDVRKIQQDGTVIVTVAECAQQFRGNLVTLKPGERTTVEGFPIETVRAYNVRKAFHPKVKDWVGFIIEVEGVKIYHAGDTDQIAEMKGFKADVALLPVGGTYTMDSAEAAHAALDIGPKVAVPMHYGAIVGSETDAGNFEQMLRGKVSVEIMRVGG
jgi:L-ascorbate metabolism protein UlaG (beta-lactamase superfamily)